MIWSNALQHIAVDYIRHVSQSILIRCSVMEVWPWTSCEGAAAIAHFTSFWSGSLHFLQSPGSFEYHQSVTHALTSTSSKQMEDRLRHAGGPVQHQFLYINSRLILSRGKISQKWFFLFSPLSRINYLIGVWNPNVRSTAQCATGWAILASWVFNFS